MHETSAQWERRMADIWLQIDQHERDAFVALVDAHAQGLNPGDAIGFFERAGARDSTGSP
jgi:hypothetical protein